MKKVTRKKYILAGGITVAILVLLFGVMDQSGYVLSGPYIVKGGTLVLEETQPNSEVFIDNRRTGEVTVDGIGSFDGLKPGTRSIIVAHPDFWPWILDFQAYPGQVTTLRPLQVRREQSDASITITEPANKKVAESALVQYREPTRFQPLARGNLRVWIEGATIFLHTGEEFVELYSSTDPIRNIFWYGDREDAVIVASQDTVFALDLRVSRVQNFFPIYRGVAPEAVADPTQPRRIFIRDAREYLAIDL
ncbi:hypothetical protein CL652_01800 [bacterium]|nr:hypothetical protein [bacterium]|tara:strand:+ start:12265 stop:13014 length:750 start_codon:yes stop_codon:yes gene_type:complete